MTKREILDQLRAIATMPDLYNDRVQVHNLRNHLAEMIECLNREVAGEERDTDRTNFWELAVQRGVQLDVLRSEIDALRGEKAGAKNEAWLQREAKEIYRKERDTLASALEARVAELERLVTSMRRDAAWPGVQDHGPCAHCGRNVIGSHPWFTAQGGKPIHDECRHLRNLEPV